MIHNLLSLSCSVIYFFLGWIIVYILCNDLHATTSEMIRNLLPLGLSVICSIWGDSYSPPTCILSHPNYVTLTITSWSWRRFIHCYLHWRVVDLMCLHRQHLIRFFWSASINIFVRCGGFYELMDLLLSIDYLIECSGLIKALYPEYSQWAVNHLSWINNNRTVRSYRFSVSSILLLPMKTF